MEKRCTKCGIVKTTEDFYTHRTEKSGFQYHCKTCQTEYNREHSNPEYARQYYQDHREDQQNKHREQNIIYRQTEEGKEKRRINSREYRKNHKDKIKARNVVGYAVDRGRIPPAASFICSSRNEEQATGYHHWRGYEPEHHMDVIPLCYKCHKAAEVE